MFLNPFLIDQKMAFGFSSVSVSWVDTSTQLHMTTAKFSSRKSGLQTL